MALSGIKTWIAGEILFASDLNAEFANILNNGEDLGTPATKAHDMDGYQITMDSDGDSYIVAATDDRLDIYLQGTSLFRFDGTTASSVNGLDFIASDTGNDLSIAAVGSDTNINIAITPKGSGEVSFGSTYPDDVVLTAQAFSY